MRRHSRIQQVLRYAHLTRQHQASAMQRIEQFVTEQRMGELLLSLYKTIQPGTRYTIRYSRATARKDHRGAP